MHNRNHSLSRKARPGCIDAGGTHPYFPAVSKGNTLMSLQFSADASQKITALCERYPSKQPVVLAALHLAQKEHGHLSDDALKLVARTLDLPYAHVFGVATFYTMFRREPGGKTTIRVCTNISCMLRGAYDVLGQFEGKLGLKKGESNAEFSLVEEECIAACANAPAVLCGTKYFLDVEPGQVSGIVDELRRTPRPESEVA
jgi:NADH:ubiquinone oxidoreductase subunit E